MSWPLEAGNFSGTMRWAGGRRVFVETTGKGFIDHITPPANRNMRRDARAQKLIMPKFQAAPESGPFMLFMLLEVGLGHTKRKGLNLKAFLSAFNGFASQAIDFFHEGSYGNLDSALRALGPR